MTELSLFDLGGFAPHDRHEDLSAVLPLILTPHGIEHILLLESLAQIDPGYAPVILPLSPPCQNYSRAGLSRATIGLPAIEDLVALRFAETFDLSEPSVPEIVPLPPREKPRGTGRTSIPKAEDRRAELAARAERLRKRSTKGKTR